MNDQHAGASRYRVGVHVSVDRKLTAVLARPVPFRRFGRVNVCRSPTIRYRTPNSRLQSDKCSDEQISGVLVPVVTGGIGRQLAAIL